MIDKQVFRNISYGMYLVTTNNKKKNGCIINTLTQITSENPIISISINKNNKQTAIIHVPSALKAFSSKTIININIIYVIIENTLSFK